MRLEKVATKDRNDIQILAIWEAKNARLRSHSIQIEQSCLFFDLSEGPAVMLLSSKSSLSILAADEGIRRSKEGNDLQ